MTQLRHHHTHLAHPSGRRERGVILPLVAGSLVAILLLATLVLDGSQAYPQRRSAQNAADAAAQAGAQQLDKAKYFVTDPSLKTAAVKAIYTRALSAAKANGAQSIECWFVDKHGNPQLDDPSAVACPGSGHDDDEQLAVPSTAYGIRVRSAVDRATTFNGIGGTGNKVRARATAAATVQKLASVGSPFIVCANPYYADRQLMSYDLLKWDPSIPYVPGTYPPYLFNADGSVDVDPAKTWPYDVANPSSEFMVLQGDNAKGPSNCNGGAENSGKGANNTTQVPGWVDYQNGNGNDSSIAEQVLSSTPCPNPLPPAGSELGGCDLILPIAIDGSSATDKVYVVAMGLFRAWGDGRGSPKYYGKYVASGAYVAGGLTTYDDITMASVRVIRLIE